MLRRLPLGFAGVITAAIAIAACSSPNATQTISVGPNFPSQTLYAAERDAERGEYLCDRLAHPEVDRRPALSNRGSQHGESPARSTSPSIVMGDLWVTNWLSSTSAGEILEFKALATGNVIPFQTFALGNVRPRGIVDFLYTFIGHHDVSRRAGRGGGRSRVSRRDSTAASSFIRRPCSDAPTRRSRVRRRA